MPELPDLEYIRPILNQELAGKELLGLEIFEPVVLRNMLGTPVENFRGFILDVYRHGPFLCFSLGTSSSLESGTASTKGGAPSGKKSAGARSKPEGAGTNPGAQCEIVIHPMLAGRFRLNGKKQSSTAVRFRFQEFHLDYLDDKKMGKVYICSVGDVKEIPGFAKQGRDILSDKFDREYFLKAASKSRKQVRVFIMDQSVISSIGNAYADEILFEAQIHPKTKMNQLNENQKDALFVAIQSVISRGIETIQKARPDLEMKYRDHMQVRNRKGEPCPRCGTSIRRANVLGYDSFFCPACQPDGGKGFIDWSTLSQKGS
ncbi:MAG TPA: DNA-formamidopyrimidine glycosylase [Leptospiraceae bacterium]|nr:DNA-formamidopyrimidine glycosylase [Spirochaetaceae bacterium]HBS05562.1 DNA-formamidopyrimidine glycosylase [Leptospiraceae bacterium]|tara:strand:- start:12056 stop:13006 length:951 start_codon:yes stop_codon:yes gene_type:complete